MQFGRFLPVGIASYHDAGLQNSYHHIHPRSYLSLINILCSFVLKVQCPMISDCPALKMGYAVQNTAFWVVAKHSLVEIYCPEKPAVFFFYSEDRGSRFPQNVTIFLHVTTWRDFSEDSILHNHLNKYLRSHWLFNNFSLLYQQLSLHIL
jgi:hypothetical protein